MDSHGLDSEQRLTTIGTEPLQNDQLLPYMRGYIGSTGRAALLVECVLLGKSSSTAGTIEHRYCGPSGLCTRSGDEPVRVART